MSVYRLYTVLSRTTAWMPAELSFSPILLYGSVQVRRTVPYLFSLFIHRNAVHTCDSLGGKKKAAWQSGVHSANRVVSGLVNSDWSVAPATARVLVTARLAQRQTGFDRIRCGALAAAGVNGASATLGVSQLALPAEWSRRYFFLLTSCRLVGCLWCELSIFIYIYVYIYCILRQYISITYDKLSLLSSVRPATSALLSGVAPSEPVWSACNHKTFFSAPTRRPESEIIPFSQFRSLFTP